MMRIEGINALIRDLERKEREYKRGLRRGLIKAGLFLQGEAQQIVPIETGALKNSAFTRAVKAGAAMPALPSVDIKTAQAGRDAKGRYIGGRERMTPEQILAVSQASAMSSGTTGLYELTDVLVGFLQAYGLYVHENLTARHAEGKTAKYLETPFREKKMEMMRIIREETVK